VLGTALGGIALVGCSPHDSHAAKTPDTPALPVREPGVQIVQGTSDGTPPPTADGILITPHSEHVVQSVTTVKELTGPAASLLGLDPCAAGPGNELVIATFKRPDAPPYSGGGSVRASAVVTAGKTATAIDLFGQYNSATKMYPKILPQTVIACVPTGTAVLLRVTDSGRTASLDLRTGKRGTDATPLSAYRSAAKPGKDHTATGAVITRPGGRFLPEGGKYDLEFGIADASFGLTPWAPGRGWAPRRMTWAVLGDLTISGGIADTPSKKRKLIVDNALDLAATFHLTPADGRPLPAQRGTFKVPIVAIPYGDSNPPDLVWAVPDTFTRGVIRIQPQGTLTVSYSDGDVPAAWVSRPVAYTFPVTVS